MLSPKTFRKFVQSLPRDTLEEFMVGVVLNYRGRVIDVSKGVLPAKTLTLCLSAKPNADDIGSIESAIDSLITTASKEHPECSRS